MAGAAQKPPIKANLAYCCSFNLLTLKLIEMGCMLASLILSLQYEGQTTMIIIEIFSALALVTALSWSILYCLNFNARFPDFFSKLIFAYHVMMMVLCVVSTICAAILWPNFKLPYYVICTFTSLLGAIAFLVDAVINFLAMRGDSEEIVVCCFSPWQPELTI